MVVLACCNICERVSSAVSLAKSVSLIRLRAAETFSTMFDKLRMVDWNRFWMAPRSARFESMMLIALSILANALEAPARLLIDKVQP